MLTVGNLDLEAGTIRYYRVKTDVWQMDLLTPDTYQALRRYLPLMPQAQDAFLLRKALKNGKLGTAGITPRTVSRIVTQHGAQYGIEGLSAHDCRHSFATRAVDANNTLMAIMDAGGWKTPMMVQRYADDKVIANDGLTLKS